MLVSSALFLDLLCASIHQRNAGGMTKPQLNGSTRDSRSGQ